DLYEFQCVQTFDLDMSARACAFSPDAQYICIGYGSTIKQSQRQFDGKWAVHDALVCYCIIDIWRKLRLELMCFRVCVAGCVLRVVNLVRSQSGRSVYEARDSQKWITDIKYSPNGELLAIASADTKIY